MITQSLKTDKYMNQHYMNVIYCNYNRNRLDINNMLSIGLFDMKHHYYVTNDC